MINIIGLGKICRPTSLIDMSFVVSSEQFKGPIDLLLYLVRRQEVEVSRIALSQLTNEFLGYLEVLQEIPIDTVGDFVEVASILIEIKMRDVLPRNELEQDAAPYVDPREDLVKRLLLYKQFKDASTLLDEQGTCWQQRFPRSADDLPSHRIDIADQPLDEIELWDLVSAFGRVLRDNRPTLQTNITYDETPIQVYMQRIHARILNQQRVSFTELFERDMHKSALVGIFLAILELTRHHHVIAEQSELHSEIVLVAGQQFQEQLDVSNIDEYNPQQIKFGSGDPGSMVE